MIRFGNKKNNRKNVMATLKKDGYIYFGIARCNFKAGDKFNKQAGKNMAHTRLQTALRVAQAPDFQPEPEDFNIAQQQEFYMFGRVKDTEVKNLLKYFNRFGR